MNNTEEVLQTAEQIIWEIAEKQPDMTLANIAKVIEEEVMRIAEKSTIMKDEIQARNNGDHNQAFPSVEMVIALHRQGIDAFGMEWLAVPHLPNKTHGPVDAVKSIEAILNDTRSQTILKRSLRTMDVGKGCSVQCDTCLVDAQPLESLFALDSLGTLFDDPRFEDLIHLGGLRIGSSGDITDHPNPAQILEFALKGTRNVHTELMAKTGLPHQVKIYTNFRKQRSKKIDALLETAMQSPDRTKIVISLPLNRSGEVLDDFQQYIADRPELFGKELKRKNIIIHSVPKRADTLFRDGRVLAENLAIGKAEIEARNPVERIIQRGYAKPYLNPDGLWCFGYVGPYESHTDRAFTPMTPENITYLQYIPWIPHFIHDPACANPPPNWAGGTNLGYYEYQAILDQIIMSGIGLEMRKVTTV